MNFQKISEVMLVTGVWTLLFGNNYPLHDTRFCFPSFLQSEKLKMWTTPPPAAVFTFQHLLRLLCRFHLTILHFSRSPSTHFWASSPVCSSAEPLWSEGVYLLPGSLTFSHPKHVSPVIFPCVQKAPCLLRSGRTEAEDQEWGERDICSSCSHKLQ